MVSKDVHRWRVTAAEAGSRLVNYIRHKLGGQHSIRAIKRVIEANACQVNGSVERFSSRRLLPEDEVCYKSLPVPKTFQQAVILFEDEVLVAYDKPTGIPSDGPKGLVTLQGTLLVHRLDKETSGVLLAAKTQKAQQVLEEQFRQRSVEKTYLAMVDGVPNTPKGSIQNYLAPIYEYQGQKLMGSVPAGKGAYAETIWELLRMGTEVALLECRPKTGRTHQIRVHLKELGYPILGDYQYCRSPQCQYRPARCLLHASKTVFHHPATDERLVVSAHLPKDFMLAMQELLEH